MNTQDEKNQGTPNVIRVSLEHAQLLRSTFKGNEDALKLIRALLFGFELTDAEKGTIRGLFTSNDELLIAVQKKIYSRMTKDAPIGNNPDIWVGVENQIQGQHPDTINQILMAKNRSVEMLDAGMELLRDPDKFVVQNVHNYDPKRLLSADPFGIELLARNLYVKSIENGMNFIMILCNLSDEDAKKVGENLAKNSTK
jgi:hypothetical protein